MGNCSVKGISGSYIDPIRILMDSGGIVEFRSPIQVQDITDGYPGYGVYREGNLLSPLFHGEQLFSSQLYYLLPIEEKNETIIQKIENEEVVKRKSNVVETETKCTTGVEKNSQAEPALEVLPSLGNGVWRVEMVIDTKQLEEILSEEVNIGKLIEKMREVASSSSNVCTPRRSWKPNLSTAFKQQAQPRSRSMTPR